MAVKTFMTVADYLALEEAPGERYEFVRKVSGFGRTFAKASAPESKSGRAALP